jgi:hypothetical protein
MPSVALASGSLAFVALAVLLVPDDFGSAAGGSLQSSRSRSRLAENAGSTKESSLGLPSLKGLLPGQRDEESRASKRRAGAPVEDESNVVQSIFHSTPTIELPVAPPDPNPEPPPPELPPPPPTATIFTLESPPPPPPPPPPPEEPPAAPNAPPGVVADPPTAIVPEVTPPVAEVTPPVPARPEP